MDMQEFGVEDLPSDLAPQPRLLRPRFPNTPRKNAYPTCCSAIPHFITLIGITIRGYSTTT